MSRTFYVVKGDAEALGPAGMERTKLAFSELKKSQKHKRWGNCVEEIKDVVCHSLPCVRLTLLQTWDPITTVREPLCILFGVTMGHRTNHLYTCVGRYMQLEWAPSRSCSSTPRRARSHS